MSKSNDFKRITTNPCEKLWVGLFLAAGVAACGPQDEKGSSQPPTVSTQSSALVSTEDGTNRPGSDYSNFDLPEARPELCLAACARDVVCQAYTYVRPGVQGPSARCWLKDAVPSPVANACCTSGVRAQETNIDRPGMDYLNFDLPSAYPMGCQAACAQDERCQAYTYVRPGVQGPSARCWLKYGVPAAVSNNCCISGYRQGSETNINRPGSDYRSFDLSAANPLICQATCARESACQAYTYVLPGFQGPNARCWLKNYVPEGMVNTACASGIKGMEF
jgi:hypothetical protein